MIKPKVKINEKVFKVILVIFVFVLCLAWAIAQPYNSAPDEEMKYDVCRYLVEHGKLPHGGDESIRNPIWGISYAFTPILSYMISAVFMKIAMIFTTNEFAIVVAARLVSVICMTLLSIVCMKISEKLFKGTYKWLFTILVIFLPQMIFLGSYINNDSLALLSIGIIVYAWILGLERKWDIKSCILLAVGIGICALSYYNAYGYILCSIFIYLITAIKDKKPIKEILLKGLIIFAIAFAIAGWWFIRNFIIYDGDFLGMSTSNEYAEMYAMDAYKPSKIQNPVNRGVSLYQMLVRENWIRTTILSFIGLFGYMSIIMNRLIYWVYLALFIAGGIGTLILFKDFIFNKEKKDEKSIIFNVIFIICMVIPWGLSIYYSYFSDFEPQGRYIMPMIIPFMYFAVKGIERIFKMVLRKEILQKIVVTLINTVLLAMPVFILFTYIIPIYHNQ